MSDEIPVNHRDLADCIAHGIMESHPADRRPGIVMVIIANEAPDGRIELDGSTLAGAAITVQGGAALIRLGELLRAGMSAAIKEFVAQTGSVVINPANKKGPQA